MQQTSGNVQSRQVFQDRGALGALASSGAHSACIHCESQNVNRGNQRMQGERATGAMCTDACSDTELDERKGKTEDQVVWSWSTDEG